MMLNNMKVAEPLHLILEVAEWILTLVVVLAVA
jgi:hypothetical protein